MNFHWAWLHNKQSNLCNILQWLFAIRAISFLSWIIMKSFLDFPPCLIIWESFGNSRPPVEQVPCRSWANWTTSLCPWQVSSWFRTAKSTSNNNILRYFEYACQRESNKVEAVLWASWQNNGKWTWLQYIITAPHTHQKLISWLMCFYLKKSWCFNMIHDIPKSSWIKYGIGVNSCYGIASFYIKKHRIVTRDLSFKPFWLGVAEHCSSDSLRYFWVEKKWTCLKFEAVFFRFWKPWHLVLMVLSRGSSFHPRGRAWARGRRERSRLQELLPPNVSSRC